MTRLVCAVLAGLKLFIPCARKTRLCSEPTPDCLECAQANAVVQATAESDPISWIAGPVWLARAQKQIRIKHVSAAQSGRLAD